MKPVQRTLVREHDGAWRVTALRRVPGDFVELFHHPARLSQDRAAQLAAKVLERGEIDEDLWVRPGRLEEAADYDMSERR